MLRVEIDASSAVMAAVPSVVHAAAKIEAETGLQRGAGALNRARRPQQNPVEKSRQGQAGAGRIVAVVVSPVVDQLEGADDFSLQAARKKPPDVIRRVRTKQVLAGEPLANRVDMPLRDPGAQPRVGGKPGKGLRGAAVHDGNRDPELDKAVGVAMVVEDHRFSAETSPRRRYFAAASLKLLSTPSNVFRSF